MKFKKTTAILILLSILLSVFFIPCSFDASAQSYAQSYLDEQMEKNDIKGVVYITKNGEVLCQSARGMANTAEGKKIAIDTLFPIGSLSKQFCAAAVLMLQKDGKLSVDNKLSEYFPEYTIAKDVTIKNLLTMHSGIRNHLEGLFTEYTLSTDATSAENKQTILEWLYTKELNFNPDTYYEYSNANFFLLSLIVEQVSGQNYTDFIKENILAPLGMTNSGFYEELFDHPDLAEHQPDVESPLEYELKGLTQGAGDLVSNAKDIDKWLTSLREYTILSEESIVEMTTNYSQGVGYGYGIGVMNDGMLSHNGVIASYLCVDLTDPQKGFNLFAVTNDILGDGTQLEALAYELTEELNTQRIYGDVNGDTQINIKDVSLIQKFSAKFFKFSEIETLCADVNQDKKVNVKDATAIQKHIAKIGTNLPIGDYML